MPVLKVNLFFEYLTIIWTFQIDNAENHSALMLLFMQGQPNEGALERQVLPVLLQMSKQSQARIEKTDFALLCACTFPRCSI